MGSSNRACIVGIGQSDYAKWGTIVDRSEFQLTCEAVVAAIGDAGLAPHAVDGFASFSDDASEPALLMVALGIDQLRHTSMVWGGGGGGSCGALANAVAAVESGQAHYVVAFRGLCQGQSFRYGQFHPWTPHACFTAPFGLFAPPQKFALLVRRHMHEFGTTSEQLAEIALVCRANANRNPHAVMHGRPLTVDDYMAGRMIADPLRLHDCCLESDGAAAIVVTTQERAADLPGRPVAVLAAQQGSGHMWGTGLLGGHNMPDDTYASANSTGMADDLFGRAGVSRDDIDVAQLYDAFTGMVLFALEDFGFCPRGEGGRFVADGHIAWPDGSLPCNTSGGNLSEAYIHGFNLVVEAVRQLRGASTAQVENAELALVCGGESVTPTSGAILARMS